MRIFISVILALILHATALADEWQANPDDKLQVKVSDTLAAFREQRPELADYLQQSHGYAVFPNVVRIGAMWGGAYGKGLVFEDGKPVGRCSQWLGSLGAQLGAQSYRQLILFRTDEALETFKQGRVEFEGRASAVVATAGGAMDPANLPDVAIFSLVKGGLMAELSAGGVKYNYKPLKPEQESNPD